PHSLILHITLTPPPPSNYFFFLMTPPPPPSTLFPYTTLFRSLTPKHLRQKHIVLLPTKVAMMPHRAHQHGRRIFRLGHARRKKQDRKSTRLNSSHLGISYAVFCLKKKKKK